MKPITLEEALRGCLAWVETKPDENIGTTLKQATVWKKDDPILGEFIVVKELNEYWKYSVHFPEGYMKLWRCWKNKPTLEEMEAAAWEK